MRLLVAGITLSSPCSPAVPGPGVLRVSLVVVLKSDPLSYRRGFPPATLLRGNACPLRWLGASLIGLLLHSDHLFGKNNNKANLNIVPIS